MINEPKISSPDQSVETGKWAVISFFLLTFAISWACFIPVALNSQGIITLPFPSEILILLGVFGPTVSAFILTWRLSGRTGIWQLLRRGFDPRFPLFVYCFVILVPLLTALIGYLLTGGRDPNLDILSLAGTAILYFFLGGSFGEEFGWRGFALPRLLEFRSALPRVAHSRYVLGIVASASILDSRFKSIFHSVLVIRDLRCIARRAIHLGLFA